MVKRAVIALILFIAVFACGFGWGNYYGRSSMLKLANDAVDLARQWMAHSEIWKTGCREVLIDYDVLRADYDRAETEYKALELKYIQARNKPPVFVDKIVTETEIVIETEYVEVRQDNEDWDNVAELKEFIAEHKSEFVVVLQAGEDGIAQFDGQCVGVAIGWRELAGNYGKNLEVITVSPSEYYRVFGRAIKEYHAILMAIIKNGDLLYYEPGTGEIKKASYVP